MKNRFCFVFLFVSFWLLVSNSYTFAQPIYDQCSDAIIMCPQESYDFTNQGATQTNYQYGEDDFTTCFVPKKTVWLKFKSSTAGGNLLVNLSQLQFVSTANNHLNIAFIRAGFACDGTTYTVDSCISGIQNNQVISLSNIMPETNYLVCISGYEFNSTVSEFSGRISLSGPAIDRPVPAISIYTPEQAICENSAVVLTSYLSNCPDSSQFRWYKNGQLFAVSDSSFITTTGIQTGDLITVENNCFLGCTDTIQASLPPFIVNSFQIQVSNDTAIFAGNNAFLQVYTNVDSVFWNPSYLVQYADSSATFAFPNQTTTFYATAYRQGCAVTASIEVFVNQDLTIFNTFSPNGDNINDTWVIPGIENYPDVEVAVFTQWGQRVFYLRGYNQEKAWDGTFNGKKLAAGTYFYTINLNDQLRTDVIKGALNLIR